MDFLCGKIVFLLEKSITLYYLTGKAKGLRMKSEKKSAVITFKAEDELLSALEKVPNKSQFIRAAVLNALAETCPLCGGAGFLNERQLKHWKNFERGHRIHRCGRCSGLEIECREHDHHDGEECEK